MISRAELQERVDRGVAYMNGVKPGWAAMIRLDTFKINSCIDCVWGQALGGYFKHLLNAGNSLRSIESRFEHGFCGDGTEKYFEAINKLWISTIRALQESHKVTLPVSPTPDCRQPRERTRRQGAVIQESTIGF